MSDVGPIYQTPTDWRGFGGVALSDRLLVVDLLMNATMINGDDDGDGGGDNDNANCNHFYLSSPNQSQVL